MREIIESKIEILSEKKTKDGSLYILAPWIMTGRKNRNGRLYSQPLIQREVAKFQDRVKEKSMIGSADHPGGAFTTLSDASHIITKLSLDKNGQGWMEAKILPTSKGKNVIEIVKAGGQLGISARGAGTVLPNGIVGDDYRLLGIDIVTNPSEPTATFNQDNIFESANFNEDKKMKNMMGLSEDYVNKLVEDCYKIYVEDEGFKGSFEDFKKEEGGLVLAAILLEEGKFKNIDEALKHLSVNKDFEKQTNALDTKTYLGAMEMGYKGSWREWEMLLGHPVDEPVQKLTEEAIQARTYSYYREAIQGGYKGDFNAWKKQFPVIVEQAKEKKVVTENKAEPKVPFKSKTTWDEVRGSGFLGTMAEFEERHTNISIIRPETQKPIVEKTLRERAGIIFAGMMEDNPKSSLVLEDIIKLLEKKEIATADKRLRKKAIHIVNVSLAGSGSSPSQETLSKMVEDEIENQKKLRQERRDRNWASYEKLLD